MKALSLSHAAFGSADLERQVAYYEEVVGLRVVERDAARAYLATRSGADALVLSARPTTALTGFALQIGPEGTDDDIAGQLRANGIGAEIRSDPHPNVARSVAFIDPSGFAVELFRKCRLHPPGPARGAGPLRLGHLAMAVPDVHAANRFYQETLGFRVGDWIGEHFVFMRCGHEHHTLNFVQSGRSRMQHIAFEVQDSAALTASCDVLAAAGLRVLWGPVRHGPGHNIATYHVNPEGQIIEFFTEMDLMTNEALGYYDPRPWHADRPQRPKVWPAGVPQRDIWGPAGPQDFLALGI